MKKICTIIVVMLLFTSAALAEVIRTDDATMFTQGIELLRQINDSQSVENAVDIFASMTSGYNGANYFKMYAQALVDLHNGDYSSTLMRIEILEGNSGFTDKLRQYSLPTCESIKKYTEGRQAEDEERYIDAYEQYSQTDIIDSLDRLFTLKPKMSKEKYDKANSLFEAGEFELAAELFTSLGNYSDSIERANQAKALIPTQEPTMIPTTIPTIEATSEPEQVVENENVGAEKKELPKYSITTVKDKLHLWTGPNADKYVEIFTQTASLEYVAIEKEYYPEKDLWYALVEWEKDGKRWRGYVSQSHLSSIDGIPEASHMNSTEMLDKDYKVYLAPSQSNGMVADQLNHYNWSSAYGTLKAGTSVTFLEYDGNEGNYWFVEYFNEKVGKPERGYIKNSNPY